MHEMQQQEPEQTRQQTASPFQNKEELSPVRRTDVSEASVIRWCYRRSSAAGDGAERLIHRCT